MTFSFHRPVRAGVRVRQLAGAHPGPGEQLDDEPVAGSVLALAAVISLAASRSSRNFGSGSRSASRTTLRSSR